MRQTCNSSTNCAESPSPQDNPSGSAWDDGCSTTTGWIDQASAWLQVNVAPAIANEDVKGHGTDLNSGYNNGNASNLSAFTSPKCHFAVDLSQPNPPSVTSTAFPPTGGTTTNGHSGTFNFSATDHVPTGCTPSPCLSSGIYAYIYTLNGGPPVTTTSSSANLTIGDWGMNILQVQAEDNAGNTSRPSYYDFYVPWNSGLLPHPGDVDGDGVPDLLATTSSGGLNLYSAPAAATGGLPTATNATAAGNSPDQGTDWNNFSITHRGSVTQQGSYDDVWALGGTHDTLYLYENNPSSHGAAPQFGTTASVNPVSYPTCSATASNASNCTNYPAGWSSFTQILSPGDAWVGASGDTGVPSLFAVDSGGRLWAFQGQFGNALANPILLGSGWSGKTLIAPGQVDGQLELWSRTNSSGALNSYILSLDTNQLPVVSAGTVIPGITVSASTYPVIASAGDNHSGGPPNLYAIDTSGNVWAWPGVSGTTSGANPPPPLTTSPVNIGTVPANSVSQLS